MTVKELIEKLSKYNQEVIVMIETDDGGNRIRRINHEGPAGIDFDETTCGCVTLVVNEERDRIDEHLYYDNGLGGDLDVKEGNEFLYLVSEEK